MDNYQIAEYFSLLSKLMDIHGENSFKARSYASAAFNIEKLTEQLQDTPHEMIFQLKGIGESTGKKIVELLDTGEMTALKEIIEKTPPGIIEMLHIKGIGPKKIAVIWKEMEIETIGELLYACQENRLKAYKGFGDKTQQSIMESIEFYLRSQGTFLYAQVEAVYPQIKNYLDGLFSKEAIAVTGAYRKQDITIDELEFVLNNTADEVKTKMHSAHPPELLEEKENELLYKLNNGLNIRFYINAVDIEEQLFSSTGPQSFVSDFKKTFPTTHSTPGKHTATDRSFFENAGIQYIEPALRDQPRIIEKAKAFSIPTLIQSSDIKGIIHSHSNWSDGSNTIEEMVKAAMAKGFEYLVISDHSKSAFYAQGLNEEKIKEQHRYIDELNQKYPAFRIFKSIECDILNDGNLDYTNEVLSTFDLVITSIHSNLKMAEEKAMLRLVKAIENPYTTILGHMTGRLLLSRAGYPVDHEKIIDACAANHVVIELNAHPSRLDIDWKYIDHALNKNVLISIDPDAHSIEGFDDVHYGVLMAQKAMLTKEQNLSSFGLKAFETFLATNKQLKRSGLNR